MANYDIKIKPGETVTITAEAAPAPQPVPTPVPVPIPAPTPSPAPVPQPTGSLFWTDWRKPLAAQFDRGLGGVALVEAYGRTCLEVNQGKYGWKGETAFSLPNVGSIYTEIDILFPASLKLDGSGGGRHFFRVRGPAGTNDQTKLDIETNYRKGIQAFTQGDWAIGGGEPITRDAFGDLPRDQWLTLRFRLSLPLGTAQFDREGQPTAMITFAADETPIGYFAAASNWDQAGHWYISRVQVWERKP